MKKQKSSDGIDNVPKKNRTKVVQDQKPLPILVTAEGILGFADEQHNLFSGLVFPSFVR